MPERVRTAVEDDDKIRERLNALSTLMFLYDPRDPETTAKAQRLNAHLKPVRDCARTALATEPRDGSATAQARAALVECWRLVDEAGAVIDREGWWLDRNDSTRAWAQRQVDANLRATERAQAWRRSRR